MGRMANPDINDTVPFVVPPDESSSKPAGKPGNPWTKMTLAGLLVLILIGAISAYAGYSSGITRRQQAEQAQYKSVAAEQFDLALQDIEVGRFQKARERLERVAQLDPTYPNLTEKLAEVLALINATATPTLAPLPTLAPTADVSGVEGLLSQAQQLMFNGDWVGAIETLLNLRKEDPAYKAVEIDGYLFLALRNRGLEKISRQADLEGGLYDLTLASRFGPLDNEAQGYISWTSLYITGASFWELDWAKVVEYFSQVGLALPGLRDRSGLTASERYRLGLKGYGVTLANAGDPCAAAEQLQLSLSIAYDAEVEQLMNEAYTACQGGASEELPAEEQPALPTDSQVPPAGTVPPPDEIPPTEPAPYPTP